MKVHDSRDQNCWCRECLEAFDRRFRLSSKVAVVFDDGTTYTYEPRTHMKKHTDLPEGVYRGRDMQLVASPSTIRYHTVRVSLYIIGHGRVSFPVRRGDRYRDGWASCEGALGEIQVTLGPCRTVTTMHGTSFPIRSVQVCRLRSEVTR